MTLKEYTFLDFYWFQLEGLTINTRDNSLHVRIVKPTFGRAYYWIHAFCAAIGFGSLHVFLGGHICRGGGFIIKILCHLFIIINS